MYHFIYNTLFASIFLTIEIINYFYNLLILHFHHLKVLLLSQNQYIYIYKSRNLQLRLGSIAPTGTIFSASTIVTAAALAMMGPKAFVV